MKAGILTLVLLMLTACSSTPERVNYYVLSNQSSEWQSTELSASQSLIVTLSKLSLAKYLSQPNLALLEREHEINYANKHVWAEPLDSSFAKALVDDFNRLDSVRLLLAGDPNAGGSDLSLQIRIDHFLPTDSGNVVLIGDYWLLKKGEVLVSKSFSLSEPLDKDGYAHSVAIQRQLVNELAKNLASVITQL
jgi:uncharacterized lipoprotein YmbA